MIEKEMADFFLNKEVVIIRNDNGRQMFSRGIMTKVTESSLLIDFNGSISAFSLASIEHIRERSKNERPDKG